jgi:hypothetical protein
MLHGKTTFRQKYSLWTSFFYEVLFSVEEDVVVVIAVNTYLQSLPPLPPREVLVCQICSPRQE